MLEQITSFHGLTDVGIVRDHNEDAFGFFGAEGRSLGDTGATTSGGDVIAAGALIDRSNGAAQFDVPFFPLVTLDVPSYAADELPPELAAIPAIKPGSRAETPAT